MFCPYCGKSNPEGSAHCAYCGGALQNAQTAPQSQFGQSNYQQNTYQQAPAYTPRATAELAKPENFVAGTLAAVVGTAIGAAAIILLLQAGVIASIAGLLMAFCALKGYEKFAGKLSTVGIVICIVLILAAPYFSYRVGIIWATMNEVPFDVSYSYVADTVDNLLENNSTYRSEYNGDLATLYVFTVIGGASTILAAFQKNKKKQSKA